MRRARIFTWPPGSSNIFRTMDRPDVPEKWQDPANWPEGLKKEIGDDEGASFNIRHRKEFAAECRRLRDAIDRFNPDFVVFWGDDQYENFKEDIIPPFCVFIQDEFRTQPYMKAWPRPSWCSSLYEYGMSKSALSSLESSS